MHRTSVILATTALLAACSGSGDGATGDGATGDGATGDATARATRPTEVSTPSTGATTSGPVTVPPGVCEDVPDPAAYPEGGPPPAIPPCEVPEELVVHTIRTGVGRAAEPGDTLVVDYTGMRVEDGAVFDTSYARDLPLSFPLGGGRVIAGWDRGLVDARAGSVIRLDVPATLAYGDNPPADDVLQPGDALSFITEVRAVVAPTTAEDAPLDVQLEPSIGATEVTTEDLAVGDGATVTAGDTAIAHVLLVRGDNRVVLFNTWERNDPIQVILEEGGSLPGMIEGLEGATVGSRRVIKMPPESAFGPDGENILGLPADTDLIVVADVVGVY